MKLYILLAATALLILALPQAAYGRFGGASKRLTGNGTYMVYG